MKTLTIRKIKVFLTCLLFALPSGAEEIPVEAVQLLNTLPGRTIRLELVVGRAAQNSDSYRALSADLQKIPVSVLNAKSPLETTLSLKGSRSVDESENLSPSSLEESKISSGTFSASQYFLTGTNLQFDLTHSYYDRTYNPSTSTTTTTLSTGLTSTSSTVFQTAPSQYYETTNQFTLTQNLWNDGFGYATRKSLRKGHDLEQATQASFDESVENWLTQLIAYYYDAWLAQANAKAAEASLARRNRLLNITQLKFRRGTAERPDLLQTQGALTDSEVQLSDTRQRLAETWRTLVLTLKLPDNWLGIDPLLVPMQLDDPVQPASESCGSKGNLSGPPKDTSETRKFLHQSNAAYHGFQAAHNKLAPTTQVFGTFGSNGADEDKGGSSFSEAFQFKNKSWSVGVSISVPLGNYAARASQIQAAAEMEKADALRTQAYDQLKVDWMNSCLDLFRLKRNSEQLQESLERQVQRVNLEEDRFKIGKIQPLNVIQAGDDATSTELKLRQKEIETRRVAWKILKMNGGMKEYFQQASRTKGFEKL